MDNPSFMCGGECACYLDRNIDSFTQLQSPARETLTQCLAFDQFTGNVVGLSDPRRSRKPSGYLDD
jgi:hypothetical protein